MPTIKILDKRTAELIAAGEVVERPASVVKELVENSIDAGADKVTVEIKNGGVSYIRVTDNGCGISREDVDKAFVSHATSKISEPDDLDSIMTLGFRGEALPSVASVAMVELLTRTQDEEIGTRYVIEGGEHILTDDAGCPRGTTIVVRNLFFNTPARMKFLKKDVSEANAVAGVLDRMALSHPEVSIRFIRENKEVLFTPGDGDLGNAVYAVFGKEFLNTLLPASFEHDGIRVSGYVSKPSGARPNRSMQFFFVNGRFIKTGTGSAALGEAYKNSIMVGKFPACILNIEIPPHTVDVNVHPAKIEVRFSNEKPVFNAVYYCVKNALQGDTSKVRMELKPSKKAVGNYFDFLEEQKRAEKKASANSSAEYKKNDDFWLKGTAQTLYTRPKEEIKTTEVKVTEEKIELPQMLSETDNKATDNILSGGSVSEVADDTVFGIPKNDLLKDFADSSEKESAKEESCSSLSEDKESKENRADFEKSENKNSDFADENGGEKAVADTSAQQSIGQKNVQTFIKQTPRVIGEAFKTYIIAEMEESIFIIDKHAAHERMIYNELKSRKGEDCRQILLFPVTVTLTKEEYSAVIENIDALSDCGFTVGDFGSGMIIVSECPLETEREDIEDIMAELAGYLAENRNELIDEKTDWIYHSTACRAAIKAGDFTSEYEREKFVEKLFESPEIRCCPHGRPVMVEMTKREMEKSFGRLQ